VESKAWSCLVDLPPIAMECGFTRMLRSSGDLETFFFRIWQIWAIFLMGNPLYRLKLLFLRSKFGKFSPKQKLWLEDRLYQNWTSFGEDSFHHFLFWRISFNFAKKICEKFGNVAQLRFFFFEEWDKIRHILKKLKKSEKKLSAL
jgi:hypothetical protein